jgi:hypothetical protein
MELILKNPYRILGLLVGTSAKEQERKTRRLKQYLEAEQEPDEDFSFPSLGSFTRNLSEVEASTSKLNLDRDRLNAALFWFYQGNPITDEPAFDLIKEGKLKEAVAIWAKLTNDKEIDSRNASAFHNLSTLMLNYLPTSKNGIDLLGKSLELKLNFLDSEYCQKLKELATDSTYKISRDEMQIEFLNSTWFLLEKNEKFSTATLLQTLAKISFSAKETFLKTKIEILINEIDSYILEAKSKGKETPGDGEIFGKELIELSNPLLSIIKDIAGPKDLQFQSISDKVAEEVLQCGIDFFKEYKDESFDPGPDTLELLEFAQELAVGKIIRQRCEENLSNLQSWIRKRPAKEDVEFIEERLEKFQKVVDTLQNTRNLWSGCKPKLDNIRSILGVNDSTYLGLSTAVVGNAQGALVKIVNEAQEGNDFAETAKAVFEAYKQAMELSKFDMQSELKTKFKSNLTTLSGIRDNIYKSLKRQLASAKTDLAKILEWQFLRSADEKEKQVAGQNYLINKIQKLIDLA